MRSRGIIIAKPPGEVPTRAELAAARGAGGRHLTLVRPGTRVKGETTPPPPPRLELSPEERQRCDQRETICAGCEHYIGVCPLRSPQAKERCGAWLVNVRPSEIVWLIDPGSACPAGKW